jgi:hypothetical protein
MHGNILVQRGDHPSKFWNKRQWLANGTHHQVSGRITAL